jgi:peptidoglycan/xylan/chitin deacetylase (PgdA/CDA1 family)
VAIGSHTRRHFPVPGATAERLRDELAGSLADLRERLQQALPILAYPHGRNDTAARAAADAAGYRAAYTTAPGRNSPGTDPYRLRRISVKAWDSHLSFLWKVLTGQPLPPWWERRRLRAHRRRAQSRGLDSTSS